MMRMTCLLVQWSVPGREFESHTGQIKLCGEYDHLLCLDVALTVTDSFMARMLVCIKNLCKYNYLQNLRDV